MNTRVTLTRDNWHNRGKKKHSLDFSRHMCDITRPTTLSEKRPSKSFSDTDAMLFGHRTAHDPHAHRRWHTLGSLSYGEPTTQSQVYNMEPKFHKKYGTKDAKIEAHTMNSSHEDTKASSMADSCVSYGEATAQSQVCNMEPNFHKKYGNKNKVIERHTLNSSQVNTKASSMTDSCVSYGEATSQSQVYNMEPKFHKKYGNKNKMIERHPLNSPQVNTKASSMTDSIYCCIDEDARSFCDSVSSRASSGITNVELAGQCTGKGNDDLLQRISKFDAIERWLQHLPRPVL